MTTAQVVETSITVNNNSPIQDYVHPDDQTQRTFYIIIVIIIIMIIKETFLILEADGHNGWFCHAHVLTMNLYIIFSTNSYAFSLRISFLYVYGEEL